MYIMYVCLSNIHEENKNYVWVLEILTFVVVIRLEIFHLFLTLLQHLFKSNCQKTFKFFFVISRLLKTVLAFKISIFALVKTLLYQITRCFKCKLCKFNIDFRFQKLFVHVLGNFKANILLLLACIKLLIIHEI